MKLFDRWCRHQWETISSTFNRPVPLERADGHDLWDEDLQKMIHGFTVFVQRCTACGKVKTRETVGRADIPANIIQETE